RRAVQGHLSTSHHIGLVYLDWRVFRILWDYCVGALAFPYRLSSQCRAIVDLWTDHQQRGTLRYNRRNLSHRCYCTQAVAHTQPRRVLRSADSLCLPAATDGSRDTCGRHDRVLFSQPLTHIACDLYGRNLPNAFARVGGRRRQRMAAGRIDGRHNGRRTWGINAVFVMFGLFALMGAVVTFFFAVETRAQVLERVSPVQSSAKPPVRGWNISKSSN